MIDQETLFRLMQQYRIAKVSLYPDGSVKCAIALPPEQEVLKEDLSPEAIRKEAEAIMFSHVESSLR